MATITLQKEFPPTTKSVLTITETSRTSEKTTLSLNTKTNLVSSSGYVGTGISLYGKIEISGKGITTQTKTLTLKKSSENWQGTSVHTINSTFEVNIPAGVINITVKYTVWYSDVPSNTMSDSTNISLTKLVSQLNPFANNDSLNIEDILTLSITKYDNNYTNNLELKINDTSILNLENVVNGQEITLTTEQKNIIYNLVTDSNTFNLNWILTTYSETTNLGNMILVSKGIITNANPIFTNFNFEDVDTQVIALTGGINYVKGYSDIKISNLVATAQKGATIKYWNVNNNLIENTGNNEIILENYASNSITIYAVDSRGNSTPLTKPIQNFIEYQKLTKGNQDNKRIDNVTEQVNISFEGDFFECDFGNTLNKLNVSYKYKKTTDNEYIIGETEINPTIENNKYSFNGLIKGDTSLGFDIGSSYNIEVEVSDELSKVEYSYVIQAGIPAFAVFGNKMAIGDMYDESKSEYNVQLWNKILVNGIDIYDLFDKDTGWINAELESDFKLYNSSSYCRYRRIGKTVNIQFVLSPTSSSNVLNSATETTAFYIPEEFRPSQNLNILCQGSGTNIFNVGVNTSGTVNIYRYRNSSSYSSTPPGTSTWLPANITYFID